VAIAYLDEHEDAEETQRTVQQEGRRCVTIPGDVGSHEHCLQAVRTACILVNNASEQHPQDSLAKIVVSHASILLGKGLGEMTSEQYAARGVIPSQPLS
jgi:hypothetical protein